MFQQMEKMQSQMMQGFGMSDPFKNDPFFNGSGKGGMFDRADKMMEQMRTNMDRDFGSSEIGQGHFIKQTYHKKGDEVYQTKAHGAIGGGNRLVERKQMYENKTQGLQKAAHERMLNNQGRKIIRENVKGNVRNFDNYKNMTSNDGPNFD